jgi:lipopolysaccharide transport system ATP-binding protein
MSDKPIAVRVNGLSKCYRIGLEEKLQENFVSAALNFLRRPLQNYRRYRSLYEFNDAELDSSEEHADILWALRDVSFELPRGEVLGVIGNNGAGKSTLLKILSRITPPTRGHIEIRGRVSSLLEVGTGFHPELNGRENVYLNGIILGMRKAEIDRKFEQIVEFSGVGRFLDTPVKHYSSGMKVRLAFSVAAHLDPDILIVDEVLAVGDVAFQKKCIGRMQEVAGEGRTVFFVSHNTGAISNLCTRAIWLDKGAAVMTGDVPSVLGAYLKSTANIGVADPSQWKRSGTGEARVTAVYVRDANNEPRDSFAMGESIVIGFLADFPRDFGKLPGAVGLHVAREDTGLGVLHIMNEDEGFLTGSVRRGIHDIQITIPNCQLYPGTYSVGVWLAGFDYVPDVLRFQIIQGAVSQRTQPFYPDRGVYYTPTLWKDLHQQDGGEEASG